MNSNFMLNKDNVMSRYTLLFFMAVSFPFSAIAQQPTALENYSLADVIKLAKDQSPDAYRAKNSFRASYWGFRTYKAAFLPSLSLNATVPNLTEASLNTNYLMELIVTLKRTPTVPMLT